MQQHEFMEKLISEVSLEAIDFACDLEQVLAEQVKYLRKVINAYGEQETAERGAAISELRAHLAAKDEQIRHLMEENRFLRERLAAALS